MRLLGVIDETIYLQKPEALILTKYSFLIPPELIRKPQRFLIISGGIERKHWKETGKQLVTNFIPKLSLILSFIYSIFIIQIQRVSDLNKHLEFFYYDD